MTHPAVHHVHALEGVVKINVASGPFSMAIVRMVAVARHLLACMSDHVFSGSYDDAQVQPAPMQEQPLGNSSHRYQQLAALPCSMKLSDPLLCCKKAALGSTTTRAYTQQHRRISGGCGVAQHC